VTVLLIAFGAAAYMSGVAWFVGVVHYPLFPAVGPVGWGAYHARHSDRTTIVVVPAMVAELGAAAVIAADRPAGVAAGLAVAGLALAAATWGLTAIAARRHGRLGDPLDPRVHGALLTVHHARTALWTAHAVLGAVMVAQAA
jgi:hypothetical protein